MAVSLGSREAPATDDWPVATPEEAGFASSMDTQLGAAVADRGLKNLHAVLVVRDSKLVLERYYAGQDERWGHLLGEVSFDASIKHALRSVFKSIVGLLYGVALSEDEAPALDAPLLEQFSA